MRILVIEDEPELAGALVEALTDELHTVDLAENGSAASALMSAHRYDLVVLDWSIPPPTGIELLRQWRDDGIQTPTLMLTGRKSVQDRVSGLDAGADDYLVKPFAFAEFQARVRNLLRRTETSSRAELRADDLVMDRAAHEVKVADRPLHLTPKEFALLEYLLVRRDRVVRRQELAEHVWDDGYDAASNVIDVLIHRVRGKIDGGEGERLLHTVVGVGYVLKSRRS